MGKGERRRAKLRLCFRKLFCLGDGRHDEIEEDLEENGLTRKQYRLEAARKASGSSWFCRKNRTPYNIGMVVSRNQLSLAMYLHWMFRVNFFFLFTLSCVVFFALTIFFAGLIIWAGRMDPQCVRVGGEEFESSGAAFADAFALSWTTFSTVVSESYRLDSKDCLRHIPHHDFVSN